MTDRITVWVLSAGARISSRLHDERGQDLMEYALITGGIAIALILAVALFTGQFTNLFTSLKNCIDFKDGTSCP
jgi:Flp pilus assembly pilin Flp